MAQFKPAFGGAVVSVIYSKTTPYMTTARPGMFPPYSPNYGRRGEVIEMRIEPRMRFAAREAARWELPDPREAEVVVGVGMGLERCENMAYAVELAKLLGGAVAATRNVVHAGWPSPNPPPHCELVEAGSARVFLMRWMVYVGERGWPSADVMISTAETEVLIGDRLAGNLGVVNSAWVRKAEVRRRGGYSERLQWLSAGFYKARACPWGGKWDGDL